MNVSQKCQYALRAVFELAKRRGEGPTTVADIAKAQAIPAKFLELILGQLRQGGFTESRRAPVEATSWPPRRRCWPSAT